MSVIKFGTDGWRAVMCEDFTVENVETVVQGICNYILEEGLDKKGVVIGYDTRFFSDRFARKAATVCSANGIKVFMPEKDCPTPVTAFSILDLHTAGAIMFTASHNPPEYNGIKFIPDNAAPALPEVTDRIERHVREVIKSRDIKRIDEPDITKFSPMERYFKSLCSIIDISAISRGALKIIYDPLYATGRNYVPAFLKPITNFLMIHERPDPMFGGSMPDPNRTILEELKVKVLEAGANLGLANDGDADRFGVIDFDGTFITPNQVLTLIYLHLLKNRGMKGAAARSVATTHMLDRIAHKFGCEVIETPVGFKYIGNLLWEEEAIIGGEESGGVSIAGHIPEKDGILAISLITEIRAVEGKPLTALLADISKEFGTLYSNRIDIHCTEKEKKEFFSGIKENVPDRIAGVGVINYTDMDGFKFYLDDGSWVLFRPSGTEPLVRIYMEALDKERLQLLTEEAQAMFVGSKITR